MVLGAIQIIHDTLGGGRGAQQMSHGAGRESAKVSRVIF